MRADRLVATLLLLQSRGRVTAAQLAEELEISVATARRDLEALSTAGIPVYPQPGRGGGWELVGGARTDLTGLTGNEAQALFLLAGPATTASPEVRSALRKLVRALPSTFRAEAEAASKAVVIDSTRWSGRRRERPALVDTLQAAVVQRRKIRFDYRSRSRDSGSFLVDPLGLVDKDDVWYLVAGTDAESAAENDHRTFRIDRMAALEVTDLAAQRPVDFDLSAAWQRVVDQVEEQRSLLEAVVLVDAKLVFVLRGQFGRHCQVEAELAAGLARVRVAAPTPLMVAQHLAGWGAAVEVVEPASVRAELARIGQELATAYWAS